MVLVAIDLAFWSEDMGEKITNSTNYSKRNVRG